MGGQPTQSDRLGNDTGSPDETGFSGAARERLVGRLAAELGAAWNRALAVGADPRRLIGRVEAARRRIRTAPPGHRAADRPGGGQS